MDKVITFGEIMLRLRSPEHERLFQSPSLEATFGGGEANVAVSLSMLGGNSSFVTALPDTPVGDGAVNELRRYGVDVSHIRRSPGRLGIYFLETGADQRASTVIYDREGSSVSRIQRGDFDWNSICSGARWFHLTGITPALTQNTADVADEALRAAKACGLTVSIDLNYRNKLWKYGKKAPEVMRSLVKYADVLIANEEDIQKCLGIAAPSVSVESGSLDVSAYRELTERVKAEFPNVAVVAVTLRESQSADRNIWSAVLSGRSGFHTSVRYQVQDIVDRVGGGDAFSAGLIFGLLEFAGDEKRALDFATAASCLKHTVNGDFNLVRRAEVEALCGGDTSGRVRR